jgi:hypothetical protein
VKIATILLLVLNAALLVPAAADYSQFLVIASLIVALALLIAAFVRGDAKPPAEPAVAQAVKPILAAVPQNQAQVEVVTLLGIFQEKGRFVDFLMEDIAPFSDAEVGSVARAVHQGCKAALNEHFQIEAIRPEGEGARVTVPVGYAADEFRLVGNLSGAAPFTGKIVHKGWRATSVKLPRILNADSNHLPAIAPAQVEIS